jgi:hypothetical protein
MSCAPNGWTLVRPVQDVDRELAEYRTPKGGLVVLCHGCGAGVCEMCGGCDCYESVGTPCRECGL